MDPIFSTPKTTCPSFYAVPPYPSPLPQLLPGLLGLSFLTLYLPISRQPAIPSFYIMCANNQPSSFHGLSLTRIIPSAQFSSLSVFVIPSWPCFFIILRFTQLPPLLIFRNSTAYMLNDFSIFNCTQAINPSSFAMVLNKFNILYSVDKPPTSSPPIIYFFHYQHPCSSHFACFSSFDNVNIDQLTSVLLASISYSYNLHSVSFLISRPSTKGYKLLLIFPFSSPFRLFSLFSPLGKNYNLSISR